jgi:peptidyl-tRNA hydrolase, PTH1 family
MLEKKIEDLKAIIGLGNPGQKYYNTRHNIGFRIVDALAEAHTAYWQEKENLLFAEVHHGVKKILLIKPQTFMNASGKVMPFLTKQGIKAENMLVVHDELELPFGKIKVRFGGGARGHNGLRSLIEVIGKDFARLSFGIGRPEDREDVGTYVLQNFSETPEDVELHIGEAIAKIGQMLKEEC